MPFRIKRLLREKGCNELSPCNIKEYDVVMQKFPSSWALLQKISGNGIRKPKGSHQASEVRSIGQDETK